MAYLFRGVHAQHPAIAVARRGEVHPANPLGHITPEQHNLDLDASLINSPYSSWTYREEVARKHRDKTGPGGVILRVPQTAPQKGDTWYWEQSPDGYFEDEILMHGVRMNVEVLP